ncbi:hypothetical protein H7J07_10105 [Mycobacterium koreense]|uniref:ARB-07466-like C-terminal domain-containing protein n=1 Tax=Mycolicibacillus koreensis TaxID=1069220 RepID=A0AA91PCS0_9MYCO|nr:hypothetical protein [Mycolicibacillus koreensis]OSC32728.1 hypothetical protein B8W67_14655 [Mycolicibacillus koreensis]
MARQALASGRLRSFVSVVAVSAATAACFTVGGNAQPMTTAEAAAPVEDSLCCPQVISADPSAPTAASFVGQSGPIARPEQVASRWRVVDQAAIPQQLGPSIASEAGLQVKTILVARNISVVFPEIHEIGGVRADALRWHPNGLALDVMIPNPSSAEGIELGNEVAAYALQNAERFGLQDVIWRGIYYTPEGPQSSGYGHFDHVHITTTGGGYPTGGEVYFR